jgi:hypothetical protein
MNKIKDSLKQIDQKIKEYNKMHSTTATEISIKHSQERAELVALISRKNELNAAMQSQVLGSNSNPDSNDYKDPQALMNSQTINDDQHELSLRIKMNTELIK